MSNQQFELLKNEFCCTDKAAKRKRLDSEEIHSQNCLTMSGNNCCFEKRIREFERYIELDLPRTFPNLKVFGHEGAPLWQSLKDVLLSFALYRPDIGYVQGMSFIGALMLMNQETPSDAFVAFSNLICTPFMSNMYRFDSFKVSQFISLL